VSDDQDPLANTVTGLSAHTGEIDQKVAELEAGIAELRRRLQVQQEKRAAEVTQIRQVK
jgi:hypothetical protein